MKKGKAQTYMFTKSGEILNIEVLHAPDILAPAFIFSDICKFPVTVKALTEVEVITVYLPELIDLFQKNKDILSYFLKISANRTCLLSQRIQLLSLPTISAKIAHFLLMHPTLKSNKITVKQNQSQLAKLFNVARPSLSRTFAELKQKGILEIQGNEYTILDYEKLISLY